MSKKSGKKPPSHLHGMPPTKERQRQNGGVVNETINNNHDGITYTKRHRALFESILDAYLWHEVISEPEHEAGHKFRREYIRSVLKIKVYEGSGNHGDPEAIAISAINSNEVLRKAFEVLSFEQQELLITVCVNNHRTGINRGQQLLQKTLHILAEHWGLAQEADE